jgi:hypothetical protein
MNATVAGMIDFLWVLRDRLRQKRMMFGVMIPSFFVPVPLHFYYGLILVALN